MILSRSRRTRRSEQAFIDNIFKRDFFIPDYDTAAAANSDFEVMELYTTFNLKQYFSFQS